MEQISVTVSKFPEHNEEIYEAWKSSWKELEESEFAATGVKYIWSYLLGAVSYTHLTLPTKA